MQDRPNWRHNPRTFRIPGTALGLVAAIFVLAAAAVIAQRILVPSPWDQIHGPYSQAHYRFSPDYKIIATDALGERVQLWDASNKRLIDTLGRGGVATQLEFSPNGRDFAWSHSTYVLFYSFSFGPMDVPPMKAKSWVYALAFAPDNETLAVGSSAVELWNLLVGDSTHYVVEDFADKAAVYNLAFSGDSTLLAASLTDGTIHIWHLSSGNPPINFETTPLVTIQSDPINKGNSLQIALSPDGKTLAAGYGNGNLYLFSSQDGHILRQMQVVGRIEVLTFSPDAKLLAIGGASFDEYSDALHNAITVWQLSDGARIWGVDGRSDYPSDITISPDNKNLTAGYNDGSIHNYNLP
jgi:WD40 repeat protein